MTTINTQVVPVKRQILASHDFEPRHFTVCVLVDKGDWKGIVTDHCSHQHRTRQDAEPCLERIVPTPHAIGLTSGDIDLLLPEGGPWSPPKEA